MGTGLSGLALWVFGGDIPEGGMEPLTIVAAPPEGLGLSLAGTYAAWILIMAALYPACRWFAGVKRRRRGWWMSYL